MADYQFVFTGSFDQTVYNACNVPEQLSESDNASRQQLIQDTVSNLTSVLGTLVNVRNYATFVDFTTSDGTTYKYKVTLENTNYQG